jgi:hypothetical protein
MRREKGPFETMVNDVTFSDYHVYQVDVADSRRHGGRAVAPCA